MNAQGTEVQEPLKASRQVAGFRAIRQKIAGMPASGVIGTLILITIVFSILSDKFFTLDNFISMLTRISELGIITIGITFLMISGEFDLSVGAVYAVAGSLFALLSNLGIYSPIALVLTVIVAALIGLLNGVITIRGRIPSFITTLGMAMILRGSLLGITSGASIYYEGDEIVPTILSKAFGNNVRPSHFWFLALIIIFAFVLSKTVYGNWVQATGGNRQAANLMGVNTNRVKMVNFAVCAATAGFAGCIVLTRFRIIAPAFGTGIELDAIAAAVIGGTLLMGGYGTILGGALGAFVVSLVRNGLVLSGAPPYWYRTFIGIILIVTAIINLSKRSVGGDGS